MKTRPITISESNPWDRKVVNLTKQGFNATTIMKSVPLTESQIRYRQQALGVSSLDYRRGNSPNAMQAIRKLDKLLGSTSTLRRQIEMYLKTHKHSRSNNRRSNG